MIIIIQNRKLLCVNFEDDFPTPGWSSLKFKLRTKILNSVPYLPTRVSKNKRTKNIFFEGFRTISLRNGKETWCLCGQVNLV